MQNNNQFNLIFITTLHFASVYIFVLRLIALAYCEFFGFFCSFGAQRKSWNRLASSRLLKVVAYNQAKFSQLFSFAHSATV